MLVPVDEIFEVFLDEDAKLVLDPGDALRVCRSLVWDMVILEALITLIVTLRTEALRRRTTRSASG